MTTYPINYEDTGFFSSDPNVIATIPFSLSAAIEWAKKAEQRPLTESDAGKIGDIFDSKLSIVITNPGNKTDFIDNFLLNNLYLNEDFGAISVSTGSIVPSNYRPGQVTIRGYTYKGTLITSSNRSTSYLLGTPSYQRVVYQPVCTINHLHFPDGCNVVEVTSSADDSYFKCSCNGTPVFNSEPHSHCQSFTNSATDPETAINLAYSNKGGVNSRMSYSRTSGSGSEVTGDTFPVNYANKDDLENTDRLIREAIYLYYCAVNQNIIYKNQLKDNKKIADTANQALMDSTVKYKTQYLNVFNLLSGIMIAGVYIYTMNKTTV
jgi:hypothetical protein